MAALEAVARAVGVAIERARLPNVERYYQTIMARPAAKKLLTLPLTFLTLGLFLLVINALMLMLMLTAYFVPGMAVDGFASAFWGALVISITSVISNIFLGRGPRVQVKKRGGRRNSGGAGDGPVIDV